TGLVLENVQNTQKYRDVVVGFEGNRAIDDELMNIKEIVDGKTQEWKRPLRYIGLDAQVFAALVVPEGDQQETPDIESASQELIKLDPVTKEQSEIGVVLKSKEIHLPGVKGAKGADAVTHSYSLFAGPKRDDVLPSGAEKVLNFGWFHLISRFLLNVLKF